MGVALYLSSIRTRKKPYTLIQGSIKLSKMILSPEAVELYAGKVAKLQKVYGIFFIVFALIQYFVGGCELPIIVILISTTVICFYQFYYTKILTGKVPVVPIILITTLMIAIHIPIGYSYIEASVSVNSEEIRISGIYGEKIPLHQLREVFLSDTLPKISIRTNGISTGTISKGHFHSKSLKRNVKLLLHSRTGPLIYIIYANNKYVILNFRKKEKNLQVYEQLRELTVNDTSEN
jgi:hypothetical protein